MDNQKGSCRKKFKSMLLFIRVSQIELASLCSRIFSISDVLLEPVAALESYGGLLLLQHLLLLVRQLWLLQVILLRQGRRAVDLGMAARRLALGAILGCLRSFQSRSCNYLAT